MADISFGEWLKRQRHAAGLTQELLARQIHCSISALRKFEAEVRHPSTDVIERLADIFNIPLEERKSFSRFARGDWHAISGMGPEDSPWRISIAHSSPRSNLPIATSSFIGREKEQEEIIRLIQKHRLVTLTGAGGIGKSRLLIQSASALLDKFPDGVWLVEFAPLSDPTLVPQAIANTLGLIEQANRTHLTILTDFLKAKNSLLLLDNCEHLIEACAQITKTLLHTCSELHILATSREALGIDGEIIYLVPSLATPDLKPSSVDLLEGYEAVRLFVERAQSIIHDFALTRDNAFAIAHICRHLDGIPLAIELAAARVKVLQMDEIAARIDDRFRLLTGGARTALPRHQTLHSMIDWSHDLLSQPERTLLRRLSVFAGSWSLEGAMSVCGENGIEAQEILDLLTNLLNKSLILAEHGQETRYRMLETIRQYAQKKLSAAGEDELMRQCHLAYYVDLAERAEPNLRAFDMVLWLNRLESELDNIRTALEYALEHDIESELRLASAILWFWHIRGHRNEGIEWLERGLSAEATERGDQILHPGRALIRGKALIASGTNALMFFDYGKASLHLQESLTLFQEFGNTGKQGSAYALLRLGLLPSNGNKMKNIIQQSLALFREAGDKFGMAECLTQLAANELKEDNYEQAAAFVEEELALSREIGDRDGIATALWNMGDLAFFGQGDYRRATALIEESLSLFRIVDNKWAQGLVYSELGDIFFWQGDYEQAMKIYEDSMVLAHKIGDSFLIKFSLYNQGFIAWLQGDYINAAQKITDSMIEFRNIGYNWLTGSSMHALGDIALAQGNDAHAAQWYENELAFGKEIEMYATQAFASCGLGKVAWIQNNFPLAARRFEEGLRMSQETDFRYGELHAIYGLGRVALSTGDYSIARRYFEKMLEMQRLRLSPLYRWNWLKTYGYAIAYPFDGFAIVATMQNQIKRATRLLSIAEILYIPLRFEMSAKERIEHDNAIATARSTLGEEAYIAAWEEGKKMSIDEAIAYALKED